MLSFPLSLPPSRLWMVWLWVVVWSVTTNFFVCNSNGSSGRAVNISALACSRARYVQQSTNPRAVPPIKTLKEGDLVLVTHGKSLISTVKWPAFCFKYYGLCGVLKSATLATHWFWHLDVILEKGFMLVALHSSTKRLWDDVLPL